MRRKLGLIEWLTLAACVVVLVLLLLPGPDQDATHRVPTRPSPYGPVPGSLAGEYYLGFGRGKNWWLRILPDGRYSYIWMGCCGVYRRESGYVRRKGDAYVLSPVVPDEVPPMNRTLRPVRWGDRAYLVPPDRMQSFCDAILRGDEPRGEQRGNFYVRLPLAPARGRPELPGIWADYLRERAKDAQDASVDDDDGPPSPAPSGGPGIGPAAEGRS